MTEQSWDQLWNATLVLVLLSVELVSVVQMMCEDGDLKEMGVPLGPRKKLLSHLYELKQKQVLVTGR